MRFALTHKLTCYLMVLSATASLLFSPELSIATTVLALVGIAASWFAEPPRYPLVRLTLAWNIVTLAVFALLVLQVVAAGESLIGAGVHFLLLVLVNKLFNRRRSRDYQQIYVVSFLMLVAATTLNTSLTYALCFIAYTVFATWSLILFHLRREMEDNYLLKHTDDGGQSEKVQVERILNSRRIVGASFLAGTSLISLGVLLGAATIFTFFPRIGFGLFAAHKRRPVTMAGFSERVRLGQHGTIRDNPQVVMRVVFGAKGRPLGTPPAGALLWRGSVYDRYARGGWSHGRQFSGHPRPVLPADGLFRMNYAPGLDERSTPAMLRRTLLRQQIYLEPLDSRVIFAADRPVALEIPRRRLSHKLIFLPRRGPLGELRADRHRTSGVLYVAYSKLLRPAPALLRRAEPLTTSPRYRPFLQLPDELPERVRVLARRITAAQPTIYDKALAVQSYLRRNYRYSLQLQHDAGREPVDEFLFETRRGHCEYFATAMAVLLRAAGIHSRHVNGFAGGLWNGYGSYMAVRQGDAHAWTEVLFSNVGWIAFDPTPPRSEGNATGGLWRSLEQLVDAVRLRWLNYVVEYDLGKQLTLLSQLKRVLRGKVAPGPRRSFWQRYRRPLLIAASLAVALALVVWWRRRRRLRGGPLRAGRRRGPPLRATRIYQRAQATLAKAQIARPAHITPGELARTLRAAAHPCADLVADLTRCYYACRFAAGGDDDRLLAQLEDLERQLRAKLPAAPSSTAASVEAAR